MEADEEVVTKVMPTVDHVTDVACRSSFLTHTIGCEKPKSKSKSEVVASFLTDRKKKKVKRSKVEEKVGVVEGQKFNKGTGGGSREAGC